MCTHRMQRQQCRMEMVALPASLHPLRLVLQVMQMNENEVDPVETSTSLLEVTKTQAKEVDPEDMEAGLRTRLHAPLARQHPSMPIGQQASSNGPRLPAVTSKILPPRAHSLEETQLSDPERPASSQATSCTFTQNNEICEVRAGMLPKSWSATVQA